MFFLHGVHLAPALAKMHALWHALVLAHQPHDNTYGLAATPDGQTVFVDSRHCVYRSQDAGDSWQKANGAGLPLTTRALS